VARDIFLLPAPSWDSFLLVLLNLLRIEKFDLCCGGLKALVTGLASNMAMQSG